MAVADPRAGPSLTLTLLVPTRYPSLQSQEGIRDMLVKRVRMLEYALKQESAAARGGSGAPAAPAVASKAGAAGAASDGPASVAPPPPAAPPSSLAASSAAPLRASQLMILTRGARVPVSNAGVDGAALQCTALENCGTPPNQLTY
jgi:hypothetical protein